MLPLLDTLRRSAPAMTPEQFMAYHPNAWVQCYDDTPAKDPVKAASKPGFLPAFSRKKQQDCCALCFSLQAFKGARQKDTIAAFRHLGVDVDLIHPEEKGKIAVTEIDCRKEEYLERCLKPFPIKPHWLIETQHGFHVLFRVQPRKDAEGIRLGEEVNRCLVRTLRGAECANLLTQVLRIPGLYQFKDPGHPFLCRLLVHNAEKLKPYELEHVRTVLDALDVFPLEKGRETRQSGISREPTGKPKRKWEEGLAGVEDGKRSATAASLIGKILWHVPEELWETAGWGGLKEWNKRNRSPLLQRELRAIFETIARRELMKRQPGKRGASLHGTPATFPLAGPEKSILIQSPPGTTAAEIYLSIHWHARGDAGGGKSPAPACSSSSDASAY